MELIDKIIERIGHMAMQRTVRKKYGEFNLAKASDRQKAKSMIMSLQQQSASFTRAEIGEWRKAWQSAKDVENPNRTKLYQLYRDTMVDLHLLGAIEQRRNMVKARTFRLEDAKKKANADALDIFDATWFKDFIDYAFEATLYGHSLIELGTPIDAEDGRRSYDAVTLIPREHVVPEYGRVLINASDDWRDGIAYREGVWVDSLIEVGKPKDLGLLLPATKEVISKKNMLSFWDNFGQIFGMPMRIAKTSSRDEKEILRIQTMLNEMAEMFSGVFPDGMDIQLIESSRGDAFNVYDKRIERANSELSKLIIGQTMTIDDGSSLSQSETHLEVLKRIVDTDCDSIRDIINTQLLPRMVKHGFPVQGLRFTWDDSRDYTPEQQLAYETAIADRYEVDPAYFAEKYNMPVGERRNQSPTEPTDNEKKTLRKDNGVQAQPRFFD